MTEAPTLWPDDGRIENLQARFEAREPSLHAFLPEAGEAGFDRLRREARSLRSRYPSGGPRPPLLGWAVGVKDIFRVDGFATRAGSRLPPEVFQGPEAASVSRLRQAGALVLGKTVTTEFAYFTPGLTRNPHDPAHTPGGSSSGSAAAVGAGLCDLALGTQTVGSIVRPAAFCGVVGLKPTFDRISTEGVIPVAPSLDHVGCFAPDVETITCAARVLYEAWRESDAVRRRPVLGLPVGPYLEQASALGLDRFDGVCQALRHAGYELRDVPIMADYAAVRDRHEMILSAEAARTHARWFGDYAELYGRALTELIARGRGVTPGQLHSALQARDVFRDTLRQSMVDASIDAWIAPSATGPAPRGLDSTGDPVMNLPWTQAGLPAVNLPAGRSPEGLPLGLQVVGDWSADESLLAWADELQAVTRGL